MCVQLQRGFHIRMPEQSLHRLRIGLRAHQEKSKATGGNVERGKQCAVTHLIMSHAFHIPQSYRRHRLGTVEGLDLALLVDAQD